MSPLSADQSEPGARSCRDTVPVSLESPLSLSRLSWQTVMDQPQPQPRLSCCWTWPSPPSTSPPDVIEAGTYTEIEQHLKSFDNIISLWSSLVNYLWIMATCLQMIKSLNSSDELQNTVATVSLNKYVLKTNIFWFFYLSISMAKYNNIYVIRNRTRDNRLYVFIV